MSQEIILDSTGDFDGKKIKYNDYTRSLLEAAQKDCLINQAEFTYVQLKIMTALTDVIGFYTDGNSSSVMTETAEKLIRSLLFNMDFYLISLNSHRNALNTLLSEPSFTELYYKGQKLMKRYMYECSSLVVKAKSTSLAVSNIYYMQTINNELSSSLKLYDMRFGSYLCPDFSYPLGCEIRNLRGIHYLRGYLMRLCAENEFCSHYDINQLRRFLAIYSDKRGFPIHDLRVNIYSLVLVNEIINRYLGREDNVLILTEDECEIAQQLMGGLTGDEIAQRLFATLENIPYGERLHNKRCAKRVMPELVNAIMNERLKNFVVSVL